MPRHRTTKSKRALRHLRDLDFEAEERPNELQPGGPRARSPGRAGVTGPTVTHRGLSQTSDVEKYNDLGHVYC